MYAQWVVFGVVDPVILDAERSSQSKVGKLFSSRLAQNSVVRGRVTSNMN